MVRRFVLLVCGAGLCVSVAACQKMEVVQPRMNPGVGQLPIETAKLLDAIPADFGDLISVTSRADHPTWVQAWFMRPDKSLVVVWINVGTGKMGDKYLTIPRR
jgi:CelD/BcsL family acetyltransferase involved in cellulose biosynthesis